jgi:hypothetical protein
MRKTVELAETCIECLDYISSKVDEGQMEDTLYLMEDLACAFYQIVHSFPLIESIIYTNNLWNISHQLESVMYHIVCSYEQNDINSLMFNLLDSEKFLSKNRHIAK